MGASGTSRDFSGSPEGLNYAEKMMFYDAKTYLPDDLLVKVDRATMAASLEARVPYLDPRVVEFAWRLGFASKVRSGEGKLPLRRLLYRDVPRDLVDRPKFGFGIPLDSWLRGPLRDWAEALLDEKRCETKGTSTSVPFAASGRSIWPDKARGNTTCGTFSCSRSGSKKTAALRSLENAPRQRPLLVSPAYQPKCKLHGTQRLRRMSVSHACWSSPLQP